MPRPERELDGATEAVRESPAPLRQLRDAAGRPGYRELARRAHYSAATLSEAAGGRRLPTLTVTLAYVQACGGDGQEWTARWRTAQTGGQLSEAAAPAEEPAQPYRGLPSYEPQHADWFFGRTAPLDALQRRLTDRRFLAVFGPSGVGKSSLLRAG